MQTCLKVGFAQITLSAKKIKAAKILRGGAGL